MKTIKERREKIPRTCEKYGTFTTKDNKAISAGRWGSDATFCIETVGDSGFRITDSTLNKNGVAAYPSFYEGMWPRTDMITKNSKFPVQLSSIFGQNKELVAEFDYQGGSGHYNCAFDLWFSSGRNVNYKLELMIWNYDTGMSPAGSKISTFNAWDVWVGSVDGVRVVSYVKRDKSQSGHASVPLTVFIQDAIKRGYISTIDYLTSVQNGFEVWRNGVGCKIENYSVEYKDFYGTTPPRNTDTGGNTNVAKPEYEAKLDGIPGSSFNSTNWNNEGGYGWPPPVKTDSNGRKYVEFKLPSNGKRIEVEPKHRTFGGSGEAFFNYTFMLEDSFPLNRDTWQVIWQLHGNDTTSPRFALQARNNQLRIGDSKRIANLQKNKTYSVDIRANFSKGDMQVWLDGKDLGTVNVGKSNPNYYLKTGFYCDHSGNPGGTIRGYAWRLGSSLADVQTPQAPPQSGSSTGSQQSNGSPVATPSLDEKLGIARRALCGSDTGYPDTMFDSLVRSITAVRAQLIRLGISYPAPTVNQAGPFWPVTVASDDIAQQLGSKFGIFGTAMSTRDLTKYLEQLLALMPSS